MSYMVYWEEIDEPANIFPYSFQTREMAERFIALQAGLKEYDEDSDEVYGYEIVKLQDIDGHTPTYIYDLVEIKLNCCLIGDNCNSYGSVDTEKMLSSQPDMDTAIQQRGLYSENDTDYIKVVSEFSEDGTLKTMRSTMKLYIDAPTFLRVLTNRLIAPHNAYAEVVEILDDTNDCQKLEPISKLTKSLEELTRRLRSYILVEGPEEITSNTIKNTWDDILYSNDLEHFVKYDNTVFFI